MDFEFIIALMVIIVMYFYPVGRVVIARMNDESEKQFHYAALWLCMNIVCIFVTGALMNLIGVSMVLMVFGLAGIQFIVNVRR